MKRTNIDRLRIVAALCKGEDVVETLKSERTAYTEYHKMASLMNATYWRFAKPCANIVEYGEHSQFYADVLERYGKVDDEVLSLMHEVEDFLVNGDACQLFSDYVSVCKSEFLCRNGEETSPHFSFCFGNRRCRNLSGTYTVLFSDVVNTSKRKAWVAYENAVKKFVQEVGLAYAPDSQLFKRDYSSTESVLKKATKKVLGMIGEYKSTPCTEKQACCVSRNMIVDVVSARKLNKAQASELLGCVFSGVDNEINEETYGYYRELLRKL